ncbi:uncharacterized protein [Venturia canescens]|uniref:uncharacterized protein n=1 Tax=Venturia canescens TaxID=32260 RepID=UPI001C9C2B76|nr:uncharacterized protein LOC122407341 [Venturia canescens]
MATLRNPFLFVLLTHWVSLSTGTNEGDFDKSLSNSSTVPLQDKFNESSVRVPDNASSLNSFENVSLHLEPTTSLLGLIEEEKEIEVELKNLLEEAASSGQLIVLSDSQAENSNLSSIISSPLLMIENLSTTPRSPIDRSTTTSDQEIAQSQIRTRTRPRNHEEYEDIENFEDLLAIAEYEPQKLDVQETTSTETPNVETTSHRPPEEVHYDVPRRRNLTATPERPGTQVRGSTIPKTDFDDSRGQVTITESSKDPSRYQKDRTTPEHSHKAAGKKSLLPSNTHKKLSNLQEKWLRGPRHLKVLPPKNDPLEILVPREAEEYSKHPRRNGSDLENVSNFSASVRREFPPATRASPATLPLTYPTIGPNQLAVAPQRKYHEPGALPLKHPRPVNRRSDYLDYGPSEIHSLNYNLPSRPAKRPSNPEPYPAVPARTNRPNIPAENAEKESVESSSPEESAEYDYYEESEEQKQPSQRKPYSADYPEKEIPSVKAIASYDTYDESPEQRQPSQRPAYPDKGTSNSRVIPVYDSYDESDEQRRPSQRTSSPAVYPAKETSDAKVIPARGSYEENADPNPSRSYRNGAAPSPKSTESEYADYGSEEVPAKPESRQSSPRFHPAANELQALTANRFVGAPTQSVDYGHLATTIGPAARSNLVRAPIYPYQHYYSNAKPSVPVGDENERSWGSLAGVEFGGPP